MINIQFLDGSLLQETGELDTQLREAAQAVIATAEFEVEAELTIVISDDAHLEALNREYMGIDAPTDVLSFAVHELEPDTGALYLGDIIISYSQAELQARASHHTLAEELCLLVVHGGLHLLGYDHGLEEERRVMWQRQDQILADIGRSIRSPQP